MKKDRSVGIRAYSKSMVNQHLCPSDPIEASMNHDKVL